MTQIFEDKMLQSSMVLQAVCTYQSGSKVEDEVNSSQLGNHLKSYSQDCASKIARTILQGTAKANEPRTPVTAFRKKRTFMLMSGNDLGKLALDKIARDILTTESRQGVGGAVNFSFSDIEPWRLWKKIEAASENHSPYHLYRNGDPVGAAIVTVLGSVIDGGGE